MATEATELKSTRAAYPYYSLQKCLQIAGAVSNAGGARAEVRKSVIASELGMDQNSAAFAQAIGATKAFGMIEGRGSYMLSSLGKEYFLPTDENQKRLALLKMLKGPTLFENLINRFDGSKLPSANLLGNILARDHHIGASWKPRIVSLFLSSLRDAGALDSAGFLRYEAALHSAPADSANVVSVDNVQPQQVVSGSPSEDVSRRASPPNYAPTIQADTNVWMFRLGGGYVRLETSNDLSMAVWQKLQQYVQVLKPEEENLYREEL